MKFECIQKSLEKIFYKYGKLIGKHPLPFILVPLLITALSSLGFIGFQQTTDPEYLYTPYNAPSKDERNYFKAEFPENHSSLFSPSRKNEDDGYLNVIITSLDENGDIYTQDLFEKIKELDEIIRNISVEYNGTAIFYSDICATKDNSCSPNVILDLFSQSGYNVSALEINYPIHNDTYFLGSTISIGDLPDNSSMITEIRAIMLTYFIKYITTEEIATSDLWLAEVTSYLRTSACIRDNIQSHLHLSFQTSLSLKQELLETAVILLPSFTMAISLLAVFVVLTCLMMDWVRSQPWVAIAGEAAAGMAAVTAIGVLYPCGVVFCETTSVMPFLVLGIGIDDMYVMLSSWRQTSYTLPPAERIALTMKTAAISITITTSTDILAFLIGAISPFRATTSYAVYTAFALFMSYIYATTFLPACMVYSGRRERANRHVLTCRTALPWDKAKEQGRSLLYRVFCTGGDDSYLDEEEETVSNNNSHTCNNENLSTSNIQNNNIHQNSSKIHQNGGNIHQYENIHPNSINVNNINENVTMTQRNSISVHHNSSSNNNYYNNNNNDVIIRPVLHQKPSSSNSNKVKDKAEIKVIEQRPHKLYLPIVNTFYKDYYAPFIMKLPVKILILFFYLLYIGIGIWGCVTLEENISTKDLLASSSYLVNFYDDFDKYYTPSYGPRIMIAFTDSLNYSDPTVSANIYTTVAAFQSSSYFHSSTCMLESWIHSYDTYLQTTNHTITNMTDYISILQNEFLTQDLYSWFTTDINFNDDKTEIVSSRFLLQGIAVTNSVEKRELMQDAREIATESVFNIMVYHPRFIYYDQYAVVMSSLVQTISATLGCVLVVSILLLSHIVSIIVVLISVGSTMIGIVGYMSLWHIPLNALTLIYVAMCVGFSVDFSAHICYHFTISEEKTGNERAKDTLSYLGFPISQGAFSTVIGVLVLSNSDHFIYSAFFKVVFLAMVLGFLHGIMFLPVSLSLFKVSVWTRSMCRDCGKNSGNEVNESRKFSNIRKGWI